ncbi:hypothetical protein K474DRAFT_664431 [Panus rudis PR-1116 ss-1]|nr:hypothetical protein K474DRAFT_664431 [Panus rudis PR-1116 ss-1]
MIRPADGTSLDIAFGIDDIAILLTNWNLTYKWFRKVPINGAYVFRLMLRLWIADPRNHRIISHLIEHALKAFNTMDEPGSNQTARDAIRDVIQRDDSPNGRGPHPFIVTATRILAEETEMIDGEIGCVFILINTVCAECPEIAQRAEERDGENIDLFTAAAQACQRQLCLGSPEEDENVVSIGMALISILLRYPSSRFLVTAQFQMDKLRIPHLLVQSSLIPQMKYEPNHQYLAPGEFLLQTHAELIAAELRRNPRSPIIHKFKRSFRKIWYPTLRRMNSAPSLRDGYPTRVLIQWVAIGVVLGLETSRERVDHSFFISRQRQAFPRTKVKRCHWFDCLCSDVRVSSNHRLKACT